MPVLVFLGLSVFDLGPMYATDRRQTASSLNMIIIITRLNCSQKRSSKPIRIHCTQTAYMYSRLNGTSPVPEYPRRHLGRIVFGNFDGNSDFAVIQKIYLHFITTKVHGVHTLDIAPLRSKSPPQKRSGMARVLKGFHSFTCTPTRTFIHNRNEPYLPLPSQL